MKTDPKVQLNFFDQAIAFFFPGAGVRPPRCAQCAESV